MQVLQSNRLCDDASALTIKTCPVSLAHLEFLRAGIGIDEEPYEPLLTEQ